MVCNMFQTVLALAAVCSMGHQVPQKPASLMKVDSGAPAGAPGAAPGGAPGPAASPAAPQDKWGADTHADEFGHEYVHHTREGLKEPHIGDKAWQAEMHANPADFDPHGEDFLTDRRSPVVKAGSVGGPRL